VYKNNGGSNVKVKFNDSNETYILSPSNVPPATFLFRAMIEFFNKKDKEEDKENQEKGQPANTENKVIIDPYSIQPHAV
jgi:hypothetical protein